MRWNKYLIALLLPAVFFSSIALAHKGATGIVKQRMDGFKQSQQQLKSIVKSAEEEDFAEVEKLAGLLADWGAVIPEYFPEGSLEKPSEAAPAIWSDFADFSALAKSFTTTAQSLAQAARTSDKEAVGNAISQTAEACKACHKKYRLE